MLAYMHVALEILLDCFMLSRPRCVQVGAYAASRPLVLTSSWTELRGMHHGGVIGIERIRCTNQPRGSVAALEGLPLAAREVLPFWFGVDVPGDARADTYRGSVTIGPPGGEGAAQSSGDLATTVETVTIELGVEQTVAEQSGDSQPWRHSRLRWLDSTVGEEAADGEAAEKGQHAKPAKDRVEFAQERSGEVVLTAPGARLMGLSSSGLPSSLRVGSSELLAAPMQLLLKQGGKALTFPHLEPLQVERVGSDVRWRTGAPSRIATSGGALHVHVSGRMASDGLAEMSAELYVSHRRHGDENDAIVELSDVQLRLPLVAAQVPLINGFDVKGSTRPDEVQWAWDRSQSTEDHGQRGLNCRVWLGSASAGLQLNLQGTEQAAAAAASSCGNDEDGQLQCENLSDAQFNVALGSKEWHNSNRGGASVVTQPAETDAEAIVMLTVYTGRLAPLRAGEKLRLSWRLLLTPVRGSGTPLRADFATRYFHLQRYVSIDDALKTLPPRTKPWIILHQGNQLIPYINYVRRAATRTNETLARAHPCR